TVRPEAVAEFHVPANCHSLKIGGQALGLPNFPFDLAACTGQAARDFGAEKLQAPVNNSPAEQQAAIDHDTVPADAGNSGSIKAHDFRFGVRETEFSIDRTVLDPKRRHLCCAGEIDRAIDVSALHPQSAFVNSVSVLTAQGQKT